jgi:hypothetical protein
MQALTGGAISIADIATETARTIGHIWNETAVTAREAGPRLKRAADDAADGFNRLAAEGRRVFEATRTPVEALEERMRRLGVLLRAGVIDQDTFTRAVDRARDVVTRTQKIMGDVANAFESAFVDAVTGVKSLRQAAMDLLNDLGRIYARAAFRSILFSLFGNNPALAGLFSGGGGLFANAEGGVYRVAGAGGAAQVAALRATPGENVAVWQGAMPARADAPLRITVQDHHGVEVAARTLPGGDLELTLRDRAPASPRAMASAW